MSIKRARLIMKKYRSSRYNFEIEIPDQWNVRGFFGKKAKYPEFDGPNNASFGFAIGPIYPEPAVEEQQRNLEKIANKYGHIVQKIDSISVDGKQHATMICKILSALQTQGILIKNYSLIFNGMEYLVTAHLENFREEDYDSIIKTFKTF